MLPRLQLAASASLIALIFLCLLWELWLAPLQPGGTWMAAKAFPLLLPLFGILKGRRYTYQWSSLLALLYLMEGSVRATSDTGPSQWLALLETLLALVFFASVVAYARLSAPSRNKPAQG
ncbi:DUF2069 domain-containing protein [Azovibrio restrictus]|uniref:DUF2069 domain-containing protein n=1 Tax=Azovibrio restrictus TaxID=146938 RepID=UPI0026ED1DDF|nr:DUF2069 domain-containing protein [Azovibrio restrictus]